jgi:N-acyl-D-amino-acid deacylase
MNGTRHAQRPAHWLLQGGHVIDGTGASRFCADVRVQIGRIGEIGAELGLRGATTIDASGKVVAPGFIDVHTHDDQRSRRHPPSHLKCRPVSIRWPFRTAFERMTAA